MSSVKLNGAPSYREIYDFEYYVLATREISANGKRPNYVIFIWCVIYA